MLRIGNFKLDFTATVFSFTLGAVCVDPSHGCDDVEIPEDQQ